MEVDSTFQYVLRSILGVSLDVHQTVFELLHHEFEGAFSVSGTAGWGYQELETVWHVSDSYLCVVGYRDGQRMFMGRSFSPPYQELRRASVGPRERL